MFPSSSNYRSGSSDTRAAAAGFGYLAELDRYGVRVWSLREKAIPADAFRGVPDIKVKQLAARSLDVASMNDLPQAKRLTLAAALVLAQIARALDDAADMFVSLVQRLHNQAYDALLDHQAEHVERTDGLVAKRCPLMRVEASEERQLLSASRGLMRLALLKNAFGVRLEHGAGR